MESVEIGKLGKVAVSLPARYAPAQDLLSIYGSGNPALMFRGCAAAIGIACRLGLMRHRVVSPVYDVSVGDPVAYGGAMLEVLFDAGLTRGDITLAGSRIQTAMWQKMQPVTEPEVSAVEDFSEPAAGTI